VFGAIVSTLLTLVVVPLVYYATEKKKWEKKSNLTTSFLKYKEVNLMVLKP
jgi:Cu/Ag efflux pump CusA